MAQFEDRKAINGTYGQVILDGEFVRESTALKAEWQITYADVPMCGDLMKHQKPTQVAGVGTLRMTKNNSRTAILLADLIKQGETPSFTVQSVLADPDADGAERIALKNVQFSTLTLADWSANTIGEVECPFTFTDYELIDSINPR